MDGYVQDSACGVVHRDVHNDTSWLGQQMVILCSPLMVWFNDLWCFRHSEHNKSSHLEHQIIALISEGSQKEQNISSDWFDVAILLI